MASAGVQDSVPVRIAQQAAYCPCTRAMQRW